jgi:hypothetical protein
LSPQKCKEISKLFEKELSEHAWHGIQRTKVSKNNPIVIT